MVAERCYLVMVRYDRVVDAAVASFLGLSRYLVDSSVLFTYFFFFVTNWLLLLAWRMHIGKCVLIEYRTIEI